MNKNLVVFGLVLLISGCGKDKNLQDWRAEQAAQQAAKFQAVAGTYNGSLTSAKDQSVLGGFSIDVQPDNNVQASQDGTTKEINTVIRGNVTLYGQKKIRVPYKDGYYDPTTKLFRATIPVTSINGQTGQLDSTPLEIYGTLTNGTLVGHVESKGYDTYGGSFNLTKGGALGQVVTTRDGADPTDPNQSKEFSGMAVYSGKSAQPPETVSVRILYRVISADEQLLSLVTPIRHVNATVTFTTGNPKSYDGTINEDSESVLTSLVQTNSTNKNVSNLNCTRPTAKQLEQRGAKETRNQDWFCTLDNGVRGPYWTALLEPTGN